jgi:regulatory protein
LKERGVGEHVVADAVAPLHEIDETEEAFALWTKRFGAAPKDDREKKRQMRFLISRGYPYGVVAEVMRRAGTEVEE